MRFDPNPQPPGSYVDEARRQGYRDGLFTGLIGGSIIASVLFTLLIAAFGG